MLDNFPGKPSDDETSCKETLGQHQSSQEGGSVTRCPLCQEPFTDYSVLESHVMQLHSVNSDGLKRLLMLMEGSHWLNNSRANSGPSLPSQTPEADKDSSGDQLKGRTFTDPKNYW